LSSVSMRELLDAGVHFGHQTRRWNPKMKRYIFGKRSGIYIIDLQKTLVHFEEAAEYVRQMGLEGRRLLFVGTKRQARDVIVEEATRCGQFHVTHRWLGGTLTNFVTIRQSVDRLRDIEGWLDDPEGALLKKERLRMGRERLKLTRNLAGIREMDQLPDALFVVDPKREHIAVAEANKLNIPVIAIVDTNCNPELIDHIIPGNDDAIRTIRLFANRIAEAYLEGSGALEKQMAEEQEAAAEAAQAAAEADRIAAASEAAEDSPVETSAPGAEVEVVAAPAPTDVEAPQAEATEAAPSEPSGEEPSDDTPSTADAESVTP